MKWFKGDMSVWAQLNDDNKLDGPGGLMDTSTYRHSAVMFFLGLFAYFFFWNCDAMSDDFWGWLHHPEHWLTSDIPWNELPAKVRRDHGYARIWMIICFFVSALSLFSVWISRRRARKSAKGQWYDKEDLTKDELYGRSSQGKATKKNQQ